MSALHNLPADNEPASRFRTFDAFMAANGVALLGLVALAIWLRNREFALYAIVFLAVGGSLWRVLRPYHFPWWMLALFEVGIIAHFAGGLAHIDNNGRRLYDVVFVGLTFDKYVHMYNAFVGTLVFRQLFDQTGVRLGPRSGPLFSAAVALSAGMAIEMVEYIATLTLAGTGVGGYDNNMQDLYANLLGSAAAVALMWPWGDRRLRFVVEGDAETNRGLHVRSLP